MKFAVSHINGLGDQLIAWPTLRALRSVLPGEMTLLLGAGMYDTLYRDVETVGWAPLFWKEKSRLEIDLDRLPDDLPNVDLYLSLSDWASPSMVALGDRLGASRRVGLAEPFPEVARIDPPCNMFDRLFSLAQHFEPSLQLEDFAEPPPLSEAAEAAADRFVEEHLRPGERMLFVHPETRPEKMWTPEGFEAALQPFLARNPRFRVFVTSVRPYPLDLGVHRDRVVWVDRHLELSLAILRRADLFLGIDSCFLHGADLFRIPSVGLFGPKDPVDWGFRFAPETRTFATGGSLENLDPQQVFRALVALEEGPPVGTLTVQNGSAQVGLR